jgi:hypothetical protein
MFVLGLWGFGTDRSPEHIERIDFGVTRTPVNPVYDATLTPATRAGTREFRIPITHERIEIAAGCSTTSGPSVARCPGGPSAYGRGKRARWG